MEEASKIHKKVASNISELVLLPFGQWCEAHATRVQNSQDDLMARVKAHDRQAEIVRKLRSHYFNKCRQVEDLEEENKLAFQGPEIKEASPKSLTPKTPKIKLPESEDPEEAEPLEIGDETYQPEQVKTILMHMLNTIKLKEAKVPILGTYQNVSTGADIVEYIQKHMSASSVSYAERIGQDLVTNGFLRLVGNVGSVFANSSKLNYQWRPKVFQITGVPEKKRPLDRVSSVVSTASNESPIVGSMGEMLHGWNPLNNAHPNETPIERLRRESMEADEKYKAGVRKLDLLRCNLEEAMIDHLKFMERCELDRLKAIKAVILDFSGAISNVIPSMQSTVDNMMLYQETVQPLGDLRYLLENYRTGAFIPRVQVYDNYYNNVDEQTFGVDLEARARADRKRVPIIVTTILTFLDNRMFSLQSWEGTYARSLTDIDYPDLEGDEARRNIWLVNVPLAATHHLRNSINTGKAIPREVLERYEIPIVASALKLYLLELPGKFHVQLLDIFESRLINIVDSLVSSQVYEIVKTIYSTPDSATSPETRISVLQNTLGQLRLANIATLDAITTHFTRLIELTSADEAFVSALAQNLAPSILRPKVDTPLTMHERHSYRLIRDLFAHKEAIFGELKRASTLGRTSSGNNSSASRIRGISTDESNRRINMEARNRAIASKSRTTSPAPSPMLGTVGNGRHHRRDRSIGAAETRFPIQTSPPPDQQQHRRPVRASLDVPGSGEDSPVVEKHHLLANDKYSIAPDKPVPVTEEPISLPNGAAELPSEAVNGDSAERRGSLGMRFPAARRPGVGLARQGKRDSVGSTRSLKRESAGTGSLNGSAEEGERLVGVQLSDRPMDD